MRLWTSEHIFEHPWETVTQAVWQKYPNPMSPDVTGTDVLDRKVIDGILHTHRIVTTRCCFPKWTESIIGPAYLCHASEKSTVDPMNRRMFLKSINLTYFGHISINEILLYSPHPTDSNKTILRQEAAITVHGLPFSQYMENLITTKIDSNAGKGRKGLEWVIRKINLEFRDIQPSDAIPRSKKATGVV